MKNIQNCYICKHLGWENVGEGLNPICEKDSKYVDIDKSRPTVVDFNRCKLFERKRSKAKAEFINKEQLDRKFIVEMLSPTTTTIFDAKDIIDELQPADVIERSEHDRTVQAFRSLIEIKNVNLIATQEKYYALEKEYAELKANIDKAIEEMNSIALGLTMDCDDMRDYCVEILKRNIGE